MDKQVLVTYATKHGSTTEIAKKIGEVLKDNGLAVEVAAVKDAKSIAEYGAVVLGSASYYGRWRGDAVKFLKNNTAQLAGMPVWLFMSGPAGKGDPKELLKGVIYPPGLQPVIDAIKPRAITPFHGNTSPDQFSGWEKWVLRRVGADTADFRDWDMIADWAKGIADELNKENG